MGNAVSSAMSSVFSSKKITKTKPTREPLTQPTTKESNKKIIYTSKATSIYKMVYLYDSLVAIALESGAVIPHFANIAIIDVLTGKSITEWRAHDLKITSLVFSTFNNSRTLLSGSFDGFVKKWDVAALETQNSFFLLEKKETEEKEEKEEKDKKIKKKRPVWSFYGDSSHPVIAELPDGRLVVGTLSAMRILGPQGDLLRLLYSAIGHNKDFNDRVISVVSLCHPQNFYKNVFCNNKNYNDFEITNVFASASCGGTIQAWKEEQKKEKNGGGNEFKKNAHRVIFDQRGLTASQLLLSPCGRFVAAMSKKCFLVLYDIFEGWRVVWQDERHADIWDFRWVTWSPDSRFLVLCHFRNLEIYCAVTGTLVKIFRGDKFEYVKSATFMDGDISKVYYIYENDKTTTMICLWRMFFKTEKRTRALFGGLFFICENNKKRRLLDAVNVLEVLYKRSKRVWQLDEDD